MNTTTPTENRFIKILEDAELWHWFINEFGKEWKADEWHHDGWWFEGNAISYRACDLFDDHADGYNWSFLDNDGCGRLCLVNVLKSHGFKITHNSGDEEDGYFRMEAAQASAPGLKWVKIEDMVMQLDENINLQDSFVFEHNGEYQLQVSNIDGVLKVTNGVNGWGNNCKDQFKDAKVQILVEQSPLPVPVDEVSEAVEFAEWVKNNWYFERLLWCWVRIDSPKEHAQEYKDLYQIFQQQKQKP